MSQILKVSQKYSPKSSYPLKKLYKSYSFKI